MDFRGFLRILRRSFEDNFKSLGFFEIFWDYFGIIWDSAKIFGIFLWIFEDF